MFLQIFLFLISILILFYGAELLLDAADKIGDALQLTPLTIGLFILGFGTSLPEFFVSQNALFTDHFDMAIGNLIGSNISNILLLMGLASLFCKLSFANREILQQNIIHFILHVVLLYILSRKEYTPLSAFSLLLFFIYYLYSIKKQEIQIKIKTDRSFQLRTIFYLICGLSLLFIGGFLLVQSGSTLSRLLGVSEYVISVIFISFATSCPELITVLVACKKKKESSLIIGNILGSNIFNISFVLASIGYKTQKLSQHYTIELIALLGVSLWMIFLAFTKRSLNKWMGIIFLISYVGLIVYWS